MENIPITCENFEAYAQGLFAILADNMSKISPTGNSQEEDFCLWSGVLRQRLSNGECSVVAFLFAGQLAGYFQYSLRQDVLLIEEIEIAPPFRVRHNILGRTIKLLPALAPSNIAYVEAYANKNNSTSTHLLEKAGFENIGANKSGSSYLYRGQYPALAKRFKLDNR